MSPLSLSLSLSLSLFLVLSHFSASVSLSLPMLPLPSLSPSFADAGGCHWFSVAVVITVVCLLLVVSTPSRFPNPKCKRQVTEVWEMRRLSDSNYLWATLPPEAEKIGSFLPITREVTWPCTRSAPSSSTQGIIQFPSQPIASSAKSPVPKSGPHSGPKFKSNVWTLAEGPHARRHLLCSQDLPPAPQHKASSNFLPQPIASSAKSPVPKSGPHSGPKFKSNVWTLAVQGTPGVKSSEAAAGEGYIAQHAFYRAIRQLRRADKSCLCTNASRSSSES